jgi:hypothetical protein
MASSRVRSESSESGGASGSESGSDRETWRELTKEPSEERGPVVVGIEAPEAARKDVGKRKGFKVPAAKEDPQSAVSFMNMAAIDKLRVDYDVPLNYTLRAAREGERMVHSRRIWTVFRMDMFKAGLRFPLRAFLVQLFKDYRIVPCRLVPNAYADISTFLVACAESGVAPTLGL